MNVAAFYHVWADGAWETPLVEHLRALREVHEFDGPEFYGLVGSAMSREAVKRLSVFVPDIEADTGAESVTINAVREYALKHDGAILYAHTKGAAEDTPFRARWRRSMTRHVVAEWQRNLAILSQGRIDAVGCHWLTEGEHPGMLGPEGRGFPGGIFGGNFWMARCDYLRTLPPCEPEPRWKAETWIGLGKPRVFDLLPGWPHDNRWPELCQ